MSRTSARRILLMAHGAAESISELDGYYTHVRGRPPPPALLQELTERYRAIGGRSPLRAITASLAARLEIELDRREGPGTSRVRYGFRHTPPFLEDVVAAELADQATDLVGVVLVPHFSRFVERGYRGPVEAALARHGGSARVRFVDAWFLDPSFVALEAELLREALGRLPSSEGASTRVCFTAHSLPESMLAGGDPYPEQLRAGAAAIARRAGIPPDGFQIAYQSAGRTDDRWQGPDLRDVLRDLRAQGIDSVVVCAHGFVCDHLEVLYDIDIEARAVADSLGMRFARSAMPNDDPRFVRVLADLIDRNEGLGTDR